MEIVDVIGLVAGVCTTMAILPQIVKVYKTQEVEDISLKFFLVMLLGVMLWTVYGVLQSDYVIIAFNGICSLLNYYMLYMILKFR